jgi:hypothetical protein
MISRFVVCLHVSLSPLGQLAMTGLIFFHVLLLLLLWPAELESGPRAYQTFILRLFHPSHREKKNKKKTKQNKQKC